MNPLLDLLPAVNAGLNATATVLLLGGYAAIRRGEVLWHKRAMLTAFAVSVAFLACYLGYHGYRKYLGLPGSVRFEGPPPIRQAYRAILLTHVVLAAAVPLLALRTIYLGLADRRAEHRRWARWTLPIWLYVSITGVIIYLMLYQLYPPAQASPILHQAGSGAPAAAGGDSRGAS